MYHYSTKKKRLLIDVNSVIPYFQHGHTTGVGRSTLELISAMSKLGSLPFELTLYTQNTRGISIKGHIPLKEFHLYLSNKAPVRRIVNALHLKWLFTQYDLLHIPHNTDYCETFGKTIFTIHDLIVYRYPEMWGATEREMNKYRNIGHRCKDIITCSDASKEDIVRFWNVPENKVTTIHWGINRDVFHPTADVDFLKSLGITMPYFFSASCNHPRKNTPMLLEAFRRYLEKGGSRQLVLLSPATDDLKKYEDLMKKQQVVTCKDISDQQLATLYTNAHCTAITSAYEGFGLPILESLACGTPVISARNSSLTEIGKKTIDYFAELNEECISEKLLQVCRIDKAQLLDKAQTENHLQSFSWQQCAEKYVETYERLLYQK